jgi:hypothetical protein
MSGTDIFTHFRLDGSVSTDPATLAEFGADFGGIITDTPIAVLHAASAEDISTILNFAAEHEIPVVTRGRGHTSLGQSQTPSGIVVDVADLNHIHHVGDDRIVIGAGATWAEILIAALEQDRTPPVLTDYLGVSVGGTLSAGGIGGASHRYGLQTDNVLALEVVTGDGVLRTCSPTESPDLFYATLAGFGRCGVIVRATLPLIPAPARARRYKIYYDTAEELLTQQRALLHEHRFDFLQGEILPTDNGLRYMLDVADFYIPPTEPDDRTLLNALDYQPARDEIEDLTYWDFANRLADTEAYLEQTGEWSAPHPWPNLLLPDYATDTFLADITPGFTREGLGASGLILIYPIFTKPLTTPLFRAPEHPVVFLIAALRFAPDPTAARRMITTNRQWYDEAIQLGGTAYPTGAIPFNQDDWTHHLGDAQANLNAAEHKYNAQNVLQTGVARDHT